MESYKRGRKGALHRVASYVYSPPGVAASVKLFPSLGIIPGATFDLPVDRGDGGPWGFDLKACRERPGTLFEEQILAILVGSVVCTASSSLRAINALRRDPHDVQREGTRAMVHSRFVWQLSQMQLGDGIHSIHEHTVGVASRT